MKANELIRRFCRAADLAAETAGEHFDESQTAEQKLALLESVLRERRLVAARYGCPHPQKHIAWDQAAGEWRCNCGQVMNLDGSVKTP